MESKTCICPVFVNTWIPNTHQFRVEYSTGEKIADAWQRDALEKHKFHKHTISSVPTGSGKSVFAVFHAQKWIKENPKTKVIIAVPQNQIGYGFKQHLLEGGSIWDVDEEYFLSENNSSSSNVELFHKFLKSTSNKLICSHATLIQFFDKHKEQLDENCHIYIDEAHHSQICGESDNLTHNRLGEFITYCVELNAGVHLITATFMRGDTLTILPEKTRKKFSTYTLPFDEYLKSRKSFNSFSFSFAVSKFSGNGGYINTIGDIVGDKTNTAIFIPHRSTDYAMEDKLEETCLIISQIINDEFTKEDLVEDENGICEVYSNRHNRTIKILDLVNDDAKRLAKKSYIREDAAGKTDFIIALNMFREGANWTTCENAIICSPRNIVETLQISGRTTRDLKGVDRKNPHIYQIICHQPFLDDNEGTLKENVNAFFNFLAVSMIYEDVYSTIKLRKSIDKIKRKRGTTEKTLDDEETLNLFSNLLKIGVNSTSKDDFFEKARTYLTEDLEIVDGIDDIIQDFYERNQKRTKLAFEKYSRTHTDIDMELKEHAFGNIVLFTSSIGLETFKKIRESLNYGEYATIPQHREVCEKLGIIKTSQYKKMIMEEMTETKYYSASYITKHKLWGQIIPNKKMKSIESERPSISEHREICEKLGVESPTQYKKMMMEGVIGKEYYQVTYIYIHKLWGQILPNRRFQLIESERPSISEHREICEKLGIETPAQYKKMRDEGKIGLSYYSVTRITDHKLWEKILPINRKKSLLEHIERCEKMGIENPRQYKKMRDEGKIGRGYRSASYCSRHKLWGKMLPNWKGMKKSIPEHREICEKMGIKNQYQYRKMKDKGIIGANYHCKGYITEHKLWGAILPKHKK